MSIPQLASAFPSPPQLPAPRAFGATPDDLAIDFDHRDRTAVVTSVLARCSVDDLSTLAEREEVAWNLPVSGRIARLLRVLQLTTAAETLVVTTRCPNNDCRQPFGLSLPFDSLAGAADDPSNDIVQFPLGNTALVALRVPTGRDQAAWRARSYPDQSVALAEIVRSLAVEPAALPTLSAENLIPLAAAMDAADPLVAFSVNTTCPHCKISADIAVDLEAAALQRLAQHRRAILHDVHELATHYGWREFEVLALPPRRRAEYRRLIAARETSSA